MTDQIEELLREQEDDEEPAGLEWAEAVLPNRPRGPAGEGGHETDAERASFGAAEGNTPRTRGAAAEDEALTWDAVPERAARTAGSRTVQGGAERERTERDVDGGTAREGLPGGMEWKRTVFTGNSAKMRENRDRNSAKQVNGLYTVMRRAEAAARYGGSGAQAGSAPEPAVERGAVPADLERWDELVRRDARRYDGSFSLF